MKVTYYVEQNMEEKNLSEEITFLSRLIGEHKTQQKTPVSGPSLLSQKTVTKIQPTHRSARGSPYVLPQRVGASAISHCISMHSQRRVLVKKTSSAGCLSNSKSVTTTAPTTTLPPVAPHSVYINPNFLGKVKGSSDRKAVHINPTFFKKDSGGAATAAATLMCKSVHINPRLLSTSYDDQALLPRETTHETIERQKSYCAHLETIPGLPLRTTLVRTVPNCMVKETLPNVLGRKPAGDKCVGESLPRKALGKLAGFYTEKKAMYTDSSLNGSVSRQSPAVRLPQARCVSSVSSKKLPQTRCALPASSAQLSLEKSASLASSAQQPQVRRAQSTFSTLLTQAKHAESSSSPQLPPTRRVLSASSIPSLATPTRPPSLRKKYAFRSKMKFVKASVGLGGSSRSARCTPSGSLLLSVSRTKLVRLPGRGRRWSLSNDSVGTAVAGTAIGLTTTPTARVQPIRSLRTPAGSTLLSLSRTKLVRLPERVRHPSTSKSDALISTSTPARVSSSAVSSSSVTSATVTKTRYRLHRASLAILQSPAVRLARKVCSKYKFRTITARSALPLDYRSGKSRQIAQMSCSGGGVGSRYKVDHRTETAGSKVRAQVLLSPLRCSSANIFGNRVWAPLSAVVPKVALSHKRLSRIGNNPNSRNFLRNSALVRIGGLLYKSSRNKLILSKTPAKAVTMNTKPRTIVRCRLNMGGHVVYVRGDKFIMDRSGKTMQRVACKTGSSSASSVQRNKRCVSRIDIGGVTYIQKSPNVLVRTNTHRARNVVSNAKQRSIAFLTKKMRKINTPCLFYRRFGRCPRQEKGRCELVHDPKYIDICKKFLQGKCSVDGCLLSHNVGPEKMPTCRFFLEGFCVRDNCPYLHVKVNDRAPLCRNFLQGYCADGPECLKRHILVCPEFDEKGSCSKGKYCPYPHSSASRNPRTTRSGSPVISLKAEEKGVESQEENLLPSKRKRYYEADSVLEDTCQDTQSNDDTNEEDNVYESTGDSDCDNFTLRKRTKIGDLPSFIALE